MLEAVLMRTFLMKYSMYGKSMRSEQKAFTLLASVCSDWRMCLIGWPQSPTCHWLKHQLQKLIKRESTDCMHIGTHFCVLANTRFSGVFNTGAVVRP